MYDEACYFCYTVIHALSPLVPVAAVVAAADGVFAAQSLCCCCDRLAPSFKPIESAGVYSRRRRRRSYLAGKLNVTTTTTIVEQPLTH